MGEDLLVRVLLLVVLAGAGVLLVWMARATASGRLGRNRVAGIRVRSTMASDEAWLAAHGRAERPTVLAGVVSIANGLGTLLPVPLSAVGVTVPVLCGVMLALVLYGTYVGSRAAADVSGR